MQQNLPYVITIARHCGSGGRLIGQEIARQLQIAYYDKVVLSQAAEETGLGRNVFHNTGDRHGFFQQLIGAVQPFIGGGDFYGGPLTEDNLFTLQSEVIKRLASERSCVIVGRAADVILQDHTRRVSIFITANKEDRIRRVMDERKMDFKNAVKSLKQIDEQRAAYYEFHAETGWGNAETYDLCINVSTLGMTASIEIIKDFIERKLHLPKANPQSSANSAIPEIF